MVRRLDTLSMNFQAVNDEAREIAKCKAAFNSAHLDHCVLTILLLVGIAYVVPDMGSIVTRLWIILKVLNLMAFVTVVTIGRQMNTELQLTACIVGMTTLLMCGIGLTIVFPFVVCFFDTGAVTWYLVGVWCLGFFPK